MGLINPQAIWPNFSLHRTGSSRFSLFLWDARWRLLPASELRRWAYERCKPPCFAIRVKLLAFVAGLLPLTAGAFGMMVENDQTHFRVGGQFGVLQYISYSSSLPAPIVSTFICLGEVDVAAPWINHQIENRKTTALRQLWETNYFTNSLPRAWTPSVVDSTTVDKDAFERFTPTIQELSISGFISRFGWPTRYLVGKWRKEQIRRHGGSGIELRAEEVPDFVVYDLPSGCSVALYVPKPPTDRFDAALIIDAKGELVKWIR